MSCTPSVVGTQLALLISMTSIFRCSMYGMLTYIWAIYRLNAGKYSIDGAYGSEMSDVIFDFHFAGWVVSAAVPLDLRTLAFYCELKPGDWRERLAS